MKLKDININAEYLLNFLNNHICTEETTEIPNGFQVKFVYKLQLSQLTSFIITQKDKQLEKSDEVKKIHEWFLNTHEGIQLGESIMRTHDCVVISGRDFKHTIDNVNNKDRVIPETTPDQRSIHPSSY